MKQKTERGDFPRGPVVRNLPFNAEDVVSSPGEGTKISRSLQPEKKKKFKNSIKFRRSNTGVNNDEMMVSILPRGKGTIKFIFLSSLHCEAQQKSCRCVFVTQLFRCLCLYTDLKTESSIATIMK